MKFPGQEIGTSEERKREQYKVLILLALSIYCDRLGIDCEFKQWLRDYPPPKYRLEQSVRLTFS